MDCHNNIFAPLAEKIEYTITQKRKIDQKFVTAQYADSAAPFPLSLLPVIIKIIKRADQLKQKSRK